MEKVDVVYPLSPFSRCQDDWELRYSLRSIAEQDWVRNIWIIGHKPTWIKDIIHLECPDPYKHTKDANIINKFLLACSFSVLSDVFVANSDDHYILGKVSLDDFGPFLEQDNTFEYAKAKQTHSLWHRRLVDTVNYCESTKLPTWVFQGHIPYLMEKEKCINAFSSIPWGRGNGVLTHIYYNATLKKRPKFEPLGQTLRVTQNVSQGQFDKMIKGRTFLNHNNQGLCPPVKSFLENRFPNPSPWETV